MPCLACHLQVTLLFYSLFFFSFIIYCICNSAINYFSLGTLTSFATCFLQILCSLISFNCSTAEVRLQICIFADSLFQFSCKASDLSKNRHFCLKHSSDMISDLSSTKRNILCCSLKLDENSWEYSSTKFYRIKLSKGTLRVVDLPMTPLLVGNNASWFELQFGSCDISELWVISASTSTLCMISYVIWACSCLNFCCLQVMKKMLNFLWQNMLLSSLDFILIQATLRLVWMQILRVVHACFFLSQSSACCSLILTNRSEARLHILLRKVFLTPIFIRSLYYFFFFSNLSYSIILPKYTFLSAFTSQICFDLVIFASVRAYFASYFQLVNHRRETLCELKQSAALLFTPTCRWISIFCFNLANYFCILINFSASQQLTNYYVDFSTTIFFYGFDSSPCLAQKGLTFTYFCS